MCNWNSDKTGRRPEKGNKRAEKEKNCPIVGKVVGSFAWRNGLTHSKDSQPPNGAKNTDLLISAQVAMKKKLSSGEKKLNSCIDLQSDEWLSLIAKRKVKRAKENIEKKEEILSAGDII